MRSSKRTYCRPPGNFLILREWSPRQIRLYNASLPTPKIWAVSWIWIIWRGKKKARRASGPESWKLFGGFVLLNAFFDKAYSSTSEQDPHGIKSEGSTRLHRARAIFCRLGPECRVMVGLHWPVCEPKTHKPGGYTGGYRLPMRSLFGHGFVQIFPTHPMKKVFIAFFIYLQFTTDISHCQYHLYLEMVQ